MTVQPKHLGQRALDALCLLFVFGVMASGCSDAMTGTTPQGPGVVFGEDLGASDSGPEAQTNTADGASFADHHGDDDLNSDDIAEVACVEDGQPCDDEDACTIGDICSGGLCVPGELLLCNEEGPCRVGTCEPSVGCSYSDRPDGSRCAAACFDEGECLAGSCEGIEGSERLCVTNQEPCVAELLCDPETDSCSLIVPEEEGTSCDTDEDLCTLEQCDAAGQCISQDQLEDCSSQSVDNPCWTFFCASKIGCVQSTFIVGGFCDDGQPCTVDDRCVYNDLDQPGCLGNPAPIDDLNPCTQDSCLADGSIVHEPLDGLVCPIDDPCSEVGECLDGSCVPSTPCECQEDSDCEQPEDLCAGERFCDTSLAEPSCEIVAGSPVTCNTTTPCHIALCDPNTGSCSEEQAPNGTPCDDQSACTSNDICTAGHCAGEAMSCDDGQFCNGVETCDPDLGCQPGSAPELSDDIPCTVDSCDESTDSVIHLVNHALCDDDLFCNGAETCDPTLGCQAGSNPADDGFSCTQDSCDESSDSVNHVPHDENCDDGLFCNGAERCEASVGCVAGEAPEVSDDHPCTIDSCDESADLIVHEPSDTLCDDGQFCNGLETCDTHVGCQAGNAPELSDAIPCTIDACDEDSDTITHTPEHSVCNDGQFCNGEEICDLTEGCKLGPSLALSDGIDCTTDSCDEASDTVTHTPAHEACDDGLFCNGSELCQPSQGCVNGEAPELDDGHACTVDFCDEIQDLVLHSPSDSLCDDGQFCNGVEVCDEDQGCKLGESLQLSDGVPCTEDACDEASDTITHTAQDSVCSDGQFCNGEEVCDLSQGCKLGPPLELSDGIDCTTDSCDEASDTITHSPKDSVCDDGLFCNGSESCSEALGCVAGQAPTIADAHPCTVDYCDEIQDLVLHSPSDSLCDDGQFCNGQEICDENQGCQLGNSPDLSDGIPCTVDTCDEASDTITHSPQDTSCDDGLFCNGAEFCDLQLGCRPGSAPFMDDSVDCTVDACDELNDTITHTASDLLCDDGAFCNGTESCHLSEGCQAGVAPDVNDGVSCTLDSCDEAFDEIVNKPHNPACDNGEFCDGAEWCHLTDGCQVGWPPSDPDEHPCTREECDEENDVIIHVPQDILCDDGAFCNGEESCDPVQGCVDGLTPDPSDGIACTEDSCDEASDSFIHLPQDSMCEDGGPCTSGSCDEGLGCVYTEESGTVGSWYGHHSWQPGQSYTTENQFYAIERVATRITPPINTFPMTLTRVRLLAAPGQSYTIYVYDDGFANPGGVLHSQLVNVPNTHVESSWFEVTLSAPITFESSQSFWLGLKGSSDYWTAYGDGPAADFTWNKIYYCLSFLGSCLLPPSWDFVDNLGPPFTSLGDLILEAGTGGCD